MNEIVQANSKYFFIAADYADGGDFYNGGKAFIPITTDNGVQTERMIKN